MKIMLVMRNYAKNYASTIYQDLLTLYLFDLENILSDFEGSNEERIRGCKVEHVSTKAYWHNGFLYTAHVPHAISYPGFAAV